DGAVERSRIGREEVARGYRRGPSLPGARDPDLLRYRGRDHPRNRQQPSGCLLRPALRRVRQPGRHRADAREHHAPDLHGARGGGGVPCGSVQHRRGGAVLHGGRHGGLARDLAWLPRPRRDTARPPGLRGGGLPLGDDTGDPEGLLRGSRGHHDDHAEPDRHQPHGLPGAEPAARLGPRPRHRERRCRGPYPRPRLRARTGELRDLPGAPGRGRRLPSAVADEEGVPDPGRRALARGRDLRGHPHWPEHGARARHRGGLRGPRRRRGGDGRLREDGGAVRRQRGLQRDRGGATWAQPSVRGSARGPGFRGAVLGGAGDAVPDRRSAQPHGSPARRDPAARHGHEARRARRRQARPRPGLRDPPRAGAGL
ncbi:MAG: Nucleoside ABC transporter, permease protein 1, partial [uncultured Rubrobacteraceae bacterium]